MSYPAKNDIVSVIYTGKLDNGDVFAVIEEKKPMQMIIGNSDIPPTIEEALVKMKIGQRKKIRVSPDEGYGPRRKDLLQTIDNAEMVKKLNPKPGMVISLKIDKDGTEQNVPATVMEVDGTNITVDYNHPLAGHHLTYDLTLMDITKGEEEVSP